MVNDHRGSPQCRKTERRQRGSLALGEGRDGREEKGNEKKEKTERGAK
jgi:hypothetical protein